MVESLNVVIWLDHDPARAAHFIDASAKGIARMVAAFRYRDGAYLVLEYPQLKAMIKKVIDLRKAVLNLLDFMLVSDPLPCTCTK